MGVGELAERLPGEWTLIGGLMVQLHAVEHGITDVRATTSTSSAKPAHKAR